MVHRIRSQGVFATVPARAPGAVELARQIHVAYRQYGYRLAEIVEHLGLCAATLSRRLKQPESVNV